VEGGHGSRKRGGGEVGGDEQWSWFDWGLTGMVFICKMGVGRVCCWAKGV
jgi:hypothetical protein